MNSYVVSLITLNEVLRVFFRCMVYIALDSYVRNNPLENHASDSAGF